MEVAVRAAELLATTEKTRVLDIGSGSGKFCTIGTLFTRAHFIGVEQRPHLTEVARKIAEELGAAQASFIDGNMIDLDWSFFDSFYLFNPFYENHVKSIRIDDTVSHNEDKFQRYVETVRTSSASLARNQGGDLSWIRSNMPLGYHLARKERLGGNFLELWVSSNDLSSLRKESVKALCK